MATDELTADERLALRGACDRSVWGHGLRTPADVLAEISTLSAEELGTDTYGAGGTVALLETEVAELLGKPAVLMPSGTMVQQIALRIHADRRNRSVIAFHPTCHLEIHEDKAYQRLHNLTGLTVGSPHALMKMANLESIHEALAALLIELPQREIGGQLPDWDELVAQARWARDHGTAVHLDGARLWESQPFYDRPLSEIVGLFDSAYVSLYKGLGGFAGGMLVGDEELVAEAREWRHRHGGTLPALWPIAASGLAGLRRRLPRMGDYARHARAIAGGLGSVDGVQVVPDPPQTNMMHIYLRTTKDAVTAQIRRLATEDKVWAFAGSADAQVPGYQALELSVGDATLDFTPEEVVAIIAGFMS